MQARNGAELGVTAASVEVDFSRVMQRMRQLRAEISHVDSAGRFKELGIDVYQVSAVDTCQWSSRQLCRPKAQSLYRRHAHCCARLAKPPCSLGARTIDTRTFVSQKRCALPTYNAVSLSSTYVLEANTVVTSSLKA